MCLARAKTGPLFAFVGYVCGSDDRQLSLALAEAGYLVGTAYQLADDLLDVIGDARVAGKTLGTDSRRRKFTLAATARHGQKGARERITELCGLALEHLDSWPCAQTAVDAFFVRDLQPVLDRCSLDLAVGSELVP